MSEEKLKPMAYWISIQMAYWISECQECAVHRGYDCDTCPEKHPCMQTQLQIKSLIESRAEPSKEWYQKNAKAFLNFLIAYDGSTAFEKYSVDDPFWADLVEKTEDFLRNLIQELKGGQG